MSGNRKIFFDTTPDAIQMATAINIGCDEFYTNDTVLQKIKEIDVNVIEK